MGPTRAVLLAAVLTNGVHGLAPAAQLPSVRLAPLARARAICMQESGADPSAASSPTVDGEVDLSAMTFEERLEYLSKQAESMPIPEKGSLPEDEDTSLFGIDNSRPETQWWNPKFIELCLQDLKEMTWPTRRQAFQNLVISQIAFVAILISVCLLDAVADSSMRSLIQGKPFVYAAHALIGAHPPPFICHRARGPHLDPSRAMCTRLIFSAAPTGRSHPHFAIAQNHHGADHQAESTQNVSPLPHKCMLSRTSSAPSTILELSPFRARASGTCFCPELIAHVARRCRIRRISSYTVPQPNQPTMNRATAVPCYWYQKSNSKFFFCVFHSPLQPAGRRPSRRRDRMRIGRPSPGIPGAGRDADRMLGGWSGSSVRRRAVGDTRRGLVGGIRGARANANARKPGAGVARPGRIPKAECDPR